MKRERKESRIKKEMKYIISRMLLLINSIIITVQLDDNDYNNTPETTDHQEYNIPLSEYQKYITTYQHYSIFTNIFMFISSILYIILYLYKSSVLFSIIKKATYYNRRTSNDESIDILKKIAECICHVLLDIVLIGLLIVPIRYNNIILNILYFSLSLFLFSFFFFFTFSINKTLPVLTFEKFKDESGNIIDKLKEVKFFNIKNIFSSLKKRIEKILYSIKNIKNNIFSNLKERIEGIPSSVKNIKNIIQSDEWVNELTDVIMIIIIVVIIIGPIVSRIIPRIITFWSEKGSVIKDINNNYITNTIMKYILRNINNKFNNIFDLPKGSTNITLSESIVSLLLSSLTFFITSINHIYILPEDDEVI